MTSASPEATAATATATAKAAQTPARARLRLAASVQRQSAKRQKTSGVKKAMTSSCAPIRGSSNGPAAKSTKIALISTPREGGFQIWSRRLRLPAIPGMYRPIGRFD